MHLHRARWRRCVHARAVQFRVLQVRLRRGDSRLQSRAVGARSTLSDAHRNAGSAPGNTVLSSNAHIEGRRRTVGLRERPRGSRIRKKQYGICGRGACLVTGCGRCEGQRRSGRRSSGGRCCCSAGRGSSCGLVRRRRLRAVRRCLSQSAHQDSVMAWLRHQIGIHAPVTGSAQQCSASPLLDGRQVVSTCMGDCAAGDVGAGGRHGVLGCPRSRMLGPSPEEISRVRTHVASHMLCPAGSCSRVGHFSSDSTKHQQSLLHTSAHCNTAAC